MSHEASEKLKKRAFAKQEHLRSDLVETGGWKTIYGQRRFIPLGYKIRKPRHCTSCLFFGEYGYTCSQGHFCNPDSEACNEFINRTWRNK